MSTAQEYQQYADECARSANDAELSETTASLLALAQRWRMAALEIESGFSGNVRPPRDRLQMIPKHPLR